MRLTKSQLKKIINEELVRVLGEEGGKPRSVYDELEYALADERSRARLDDPSLTSGVAVIPREDWSEMLDEWAAELATQYQTVFADARPVEPPTEEMKNYVEFLATVIDVAISPGWLLQGQGLFPRVTSRLRAAIGFYADHPNAAKEWPMLKARLDGAFDERPGSPYAREDDPYSSSLVGDADAYFETHGNQFLQE